MLNVIDVPPIPTLMLWIIMMPIQRYHLKKIKETFDPL